MIGKVDEGQDEFILDSGDHVKTVTVNYIPNEMICNIEIVTMARSRFYTGRVNTSNSQKEVLEFDGKQEIKTITGYVKNGYIIGLTFEMV